jgi:hypothetical protein
MRTEEIRRDFQRILQEHPGIGVGKIMSAWLFEPPNFFDPAGRKKPKPETILLLAYFVLMAVACAAFNAF